jgi:hypothetical protein
MKKKHVALGAALALVSAIASAGLVQPAPVTVTLNADGSGLAGGDMVSARFAPDAITMIGCGMRAVNDGAGGTYEWGFCQATDAAGVQFTCFTEQPGLIHSMRATGDFSYLTFAWDANGECTRVGFSTQSFYIPDLFAKPKK